MAHNNPNPWKEHLFFIHDQLACAREEDPPENAVVVFLAPVEVEIRTQVRERTGQTLPSDNRALDDEKNSMTVLLHSRRGSVGVCSVFKAAVAG